MKLGAAIVIQSHVRHMIAQRRYKKLKYEQRHRLEALLVRELEERELKKTGNNLVQYILLQTQGDQLVN